MNQISMSSHASSRRPIDYIEQTELGLYESLSRPHPNGIAHLHPGDVLRRHREARVEACGSNLIVLEGTSQRTWYHAGKCVENDWTWSHETLLEMLAASANLLKCQAWKNDFTKTGHMTLKQGIPTWRLRTEIRATYMLLIVTSVLTKKTQSVLKRVVVFAGNMCICIWSHEIVQNAVPADLQPWVETLILLESWQHKPQN